MSAVCAQKGCVEYAQAVLSTSPISRRLDPLPPFEVFLLTFARTLAADPGAAQVEGYPFGPPPSAVLVATKRTARYHQLDAVVGAAVSGAYGEVPQAKPAHQTEVGGDRAIEQKSKSVSILQLQETFISCLGFRV